MRKIGNKMRWLGLILILLRLVLSQIEGPQASRVYKRLGLPNVDKVKVEKYQDEGRESELTEADLLRASPASSFLTIITDIFLSGWMWFLAFGLLMVGWAIKLKEPMP